MFTGIVEEIGIIRRVSATPSGKRLEVACARVLERLAVDDSVNVSGACLTVTARDDRGFTCDVVPETLSRTTLGRAAPATRLNLERAATLQTALGGHLVQGHVECTTALRSRSAAGDGARLAFAKPSSLDRYIVDKGFITLDGVSLTLAALRDDEFDVAIVPHTAGRTTLGTLRDGDLVNVEVDIVAKYVERLLSTHLQRPA
ncbi:riboflavin synthase [soil metagenome]